MADKINIDKWAPLKVVETVTRQHADAIHAEKVKVPGSLEHLQATQTKDLAVVSALRKMIDNHYPPESEQADGDHAWIAKRSEKILDRKRRIAEMPASAEHA